MQLLKFKTRRHLDAMHDADRAVLQSRSRQAASVRLATDKEIGEITRFAVGGCGGDCDQQATICRPDRINDCYHELAGRYGCPLKVATGAALAVAGGTVVTIPVQPIQSNFFLPVALRLSVRDVTTPDTRRFFLLTAVSIKNIPQENYFDPNPTAATLIGVDSADYTDKVSGESTLAVQVAWGPFARVALAENLVLTGFSLYGGGVSINARAAVYGYELPNLPTGWECGRHPVKPPSTAAA